jgi:sporulation protein YlmC with PRC-barrel domain
MKKSYLFVVILFALVFFLNLASAITSDSANDYEWRAFGKYLNNTRSYGFYAVDNISTANIRTISLSSISDSQNPIVANGYVYAGGSSVMMQLNATNISQIISNFSVGGGSNPRIYVVPAVAGDYLYIGSTVLSWGYVYQVNATNISQQISVSNSGYLQPYNTGINVYNDYLYFGNGVSFSNSYYVNQVNSTNLSSFRSYGETFSTLSGWTGVPAIVNNVVYATNSINRVFAFNASNISQVLASYTASGTISYSGVAVANGYVYFGTSASSDNRTYQLNASTMALVNRYTTGGNIIASPAIANGYVYFPVSDGKIYQLNATNISILANTYNTETTCYSSPVATTDYVFIGCSNGKLYQLDSQNVSKVISIRTLGGSLASSAIAGGRIYIANSTNLFEIWSDNPVSKLDSPADNYAVNASSASISFNCSAMDIVGLSNISLYITDSSNSNFALNQTVSVTGTSNSTNWTLTLGEGAYTWNCLAVDSNNNSDWATNKSVYLDTSYPSIFLNSPQDNYINDSIIITPINFNCSATDSAWLSNISLYITNSSNGNFVRNQTLVVSGTSNSANWTLNLGVGNYTWGCLVSDRVGYSNFSVNRTILLNFTDTTAPTINITYPANNAQDNTNVSALNYTVTDNGLVANCWWSNSSGMWNSTNVSAGVNWTGLTSKQGWNNWTVYCKDTYNNLGSSLIGFYRDSIIPNVTLNNPNNSMAYLQSPIAINFNCSAADNLQLSNVSLYITNSSNGNFALNQTTNITGTSNSTNWTLTLGEGAYTWNCRAYDSLGNNNWSTNRTLYIDVTPPNVYLISPTNTSNATSTKTLYFAANFTDNILLKNSTIFIWNSSGSLINQTNVTISGIVNSSNISVTLPYKGIYYWNYYACDFSGNCAFNNTNWSLYANSAPSVWIDIPAPVYVNSTPYALVKYYDSDNDNGTVIINWFLNQINVENDTFTNVSSGALLSVTLTPGIDLYPNWNITLNVSANDSSGISPTITQWSNVIWQNTAIDKLGNNSMKSIFCDSDFCYGGDDSGNFLKINKTSGVHIFNGSTSTIKISGDDLHSIYCDNTFCYLSDDSSINGRFLMINKITGVIIYNSTNAPQPSNIAVDSIYCDSDFCYGFDHNGYFLKVNMTSGRHIFNVTTGYISRPTTSYSYEITCDSDFCYGFDHNGYFLKVNMTSGRHIFNVTTGYKSRPANLNTQSIYCDSDFCYSGDDLSYFIKVNKTSGKHIFNLTTGYICYPGANALTVGISCDSNYCYMGDGGGYFLKVNKTSCQQVFNRSTGYTVRATTSDVNGFYCDDNYCYFADSSGYITKVYKSGVISTQTAANIPNINIIYPVSNANYTINVSALNFTVAATNLDSCWYSTNSGAINSTNLPAGVNFTDVTSTEGWNNWSVYCNNSYTRQASVSFYKDTTGPNVTLNLPIENYTAAIAGSVNISFNCSASDNSPLKNISLYITNRTNGNFALNRTTNISGTINSSNWTVLNMAVGNYTWNCLAYDSLGNSNWGINRTIWINTNIAPNVTLNYPLNNTLLNKKTSILLNATISDYNGYADNFTVWFYGGYPNGTYALINRTYNITNGTAVTFNWTIGSSGRYNWTAIANDGKANSTNYFFYFNLTNFSISCEAGGPYQQNALVLVQGTILNDSIVVPNYALNVSVYNSNFNSTQNLTTASDGGFETSFANLSVGSYTLNATATYRSYNETCQDTFQIGGPASLVLDKIINIHNVTNTTINYNITLRVTNKGLSDATSSILTDPDSTNSPYNLENISANSFVSRSYIKEYTRNSTTYNITLTIARVNATDSYSGNEVFSNSSEILLILPASETGQQLILTKNAYYNSESSTHVNYTLTIDVVNSGGVDLTDISLIDSDLSINANINLNRTQNYNSSSSIIVDKAASNTNKLFVKATATVNSLSYESNQIRVRIPGYGGPADAIVNAPASVSASTSFDNAITIENQNPDIGQDFVINYWITNEAETVNYSSGEQTIYVAASGNSNLTAILTSPSIAGNYRLRALVSWTGGTATSYDSFTVISTTETSTTQTPSSGGGGSITGNVIDIIVCNPPYIRYGKECCLDKNNNSICDSDDVAEEIQGVNWIAEKGEKVEFRIIREDSVKNHSLEVIDLKEDRATIKIYSDLILNGNLSITANAVNSENEDIILTLYIGEEKKIDLDGDGNYDLMIRLEEIKDNQAHFYLEPIKGKIEIEKPEILEEEKPEKINISSYSKILIILLGIILILMIIIVAKKVKILSLISLKRSTNFYSAVGGWLASKIQRISYNLKIKNRDPTRLNNIIGMEVLSSEGNLIGRVKESYIEDKNPKVYGWLIEVNKNIAKKIGKKLILVRHNAVISIKQIMIIDKKVLEYLDNLIQEK